MERPVVVHLLLVLLLSSLLSSACGGSGDTAGAMADRLLDALDFDGGAEASGPAPAGSAGTEAPQIDDLDAPAELSSGEPFIVRLASGFAVPADVDRAIVAVAGHGTRHLVVSGDMAERDGSWRMDLSGLLGNDPALVGGSFDLRVALATAGGAVGAYASWRLTVVEAVVERPGQSIDEVVVSGEESYPGNRPEGSPDPSAPQIGSGNGPEEVTVGQPFTVTLYSPNAATAGGVSAVILSTPNNAGYKITDGFTIRAAVRNGGGLYVDIELTVADDRLRGLSLVVLWALQNSAGATGLYYPMTIRVLGGGEDGDAPVVLDPLPGVEEPGEHACDGGPDIGLPEGFSFVRDLGAVTSSRFDSSGSGPVGGQTGNGVWYLVQHRSGAGDLLNGGALYTDAAGGYGVTVPLFCGVQILKLAWNNASCTYGLVFRLETTDCRPEDIQVTLAWGEGAYDLELHLVREPGTINVAPDDCTWTNMNPDWGVAGDPSDNPRKDVDWTSDKGVENIWLTGPEPVRYHVLVEYWASGVATTATLIVLVDGKTWLKQLDGFVPRQVWDAAVIDWPARSLTWKGTAPIDCSGTWSSGCRMTLPVPEGDR